MQKKVNLDKETIENISIIKEAKGFKSDKYVIIEAVKNYMLSEMIEHESEEYNMLKKMTDIEDELKTLKRKINYIDHGRSEEHTSELQSRFDLVCRLLLEKK